MLSHKEEFEKSGGEQGGRKHNASGIKSDVGYLV